MLRLAAVAVLVMELAGCTGSSAAVVPPPAPPAGLTAAQWRADLHVLATGLEGRHVDAFHALDRSAFRRLVAGIDARIPDLEPDAILVEMMRLVASIGDGHTMLVALPSSSLKLSSYPMRLVSFSDGLFVTAAARRYGDAVGARIVRIGTAKAEDALGQALALSPGDNDMDRRYRAPFFLMIPEVLRGLGLADGARRVDIEVETPEGARRHLTLEPSPEHPCFPRLPCSRVRTLPPEWVDARQGWASPVPQDDGVGHFRFVVLEDGTTLYVELKVVLDDASETLEAFWHRANDSAPDVRRLILDLRRNHGGDNTLGEVVIRDLAGRAALPRGLYVLIGRETFSAAQNLATRLERNTSAVFVGEPTGGKPNHYGDLTKIILPHSGLGASASTRYWEDAGPDDARPWIAPSIEAWSSFEDYRHGRDPALEAVLSRE